MNATPKRIEMIPIETVTVPNPRVRNIRAHQEITDNIGQIGLKRPITVRRLEHANGMQYALVCGQGRLESCKALGQKMIPAIVIDADEETGHVMSLVENIARRTPQASETLEQVAILRSRGYSDAEIGRKIGCSASWVGMVAHLLEKGEKRLLAAAEAGHIPLNLAVEISRASDAQAQQLLLDAYNQGNLKGKKVSVVRRILEQRQHSGKRRTSSLNKSGSSSKQMTPEDLAKLYRRHADEHRRIQKRSEHAQTMLLMAQQIFRELLANDEFRSMLNAEDLSGLPPPLADAGHSNGSFR